MLDQIFTTNKKKISCIIPAYNEERNIGSVLSVVLPLVGTLIYEIIVVDDMSQDNTKNIVKKFPSIRLVEHSINQGKSKAVADGIRESTGDYIFLLDADLLFLNEKNITDLITPIIQGKADMTISYRKNAYPLFPFRDIDYLSGERIFPKKYISPYIEHLAYLPGYGLEVFINRNIVIQNQLRIAVVWWANVENNFHHNKNGFLLGIKIIVKIWWNILCSVSIIEMYSQNIKMQKLIIKDHTNNLKMSLVICAYNEEKYIGKCLESAIKNSKGKLYEILVIDNASTDKTKEIAEKFLGVRVIYESNKGLVRARNRGYHEAKGDILAYVDADTEMPDSWLDLAIKEFEENKKLACLSGPYIYYDFSKWKKFLSVLYWYIFAYPLYLTVGYMVVGGNFVIKKETLEKMNGFDTSIEFYGEDTDIARRASKFGKVKFRLDFVMYSSARRLIGQGMIKTVFLYVVTFFSQIFIKKSVINSYKDIR